MSQPIAGFSAEDVLDFWFVETPPVKWFQKSTIFDELVRERFHLLIHEVLDGQFADWTEQPDSCLALILILDQFPRNIYRDTPKMIAGDEAALSLSQLCVDRDYIQHPDQRYRQFMLMPMMHSEELAVQEMSLTLFEQFTNAQTYDYALRHRDIIARFGRFPHRNAILGRTSTNEERAFLSEPGSSF